MGIRVGAQLGPYEITSLLAKGGMGEVYRARDMKLKRDVAIKILPEEFSCEPDRVSRFQREAEVLASVNHPNIAQIYGLEESDNTRCIVMELVEGETLQERLKRGPIPMDEALPIAKQIAEALEAAHERGIVHRDLKPGNIKLAPNGKVKVLDFGLAKAFQEEQSTTLSNSPTLMSASVPGTIIGTAAYMSPEQAKGKGSDRTVDMWAFGCVVYEMLTGSATFQGETIGEILAEVFKADPDWDRLPAATPQAIRRLLRRCLQKERSRRLDSAAAARIEIDEAQTEPETKDAQPIPLFPEPRQLPWFLVAALSVVIIVVAIPALRYLRQNPVAPPEMRLEITTPPTSDPASLAISPDGQKIVFVATSEGRPRLWLRSLDSVSTRPLAGTDGATFPFWSPDSRSVGFFADGNLKRIDSVSGSVQILAKAPLTRGGAWNQDGAILFSPTSTGPVFRMRETGGEPVPPITLILNWHPKP